MASTLAVEIVTPLRAHFRGEATEVILPGEIGEIGVLPQHRPLMTLITGGELTVHTPQGVRYFAVSGGFADVQPDRVTVLVNWSEGADECDEADARQALADLEARELPTESLSREALRRHAEDLARHRARLAIVARATGKG
jgi:F-type H+-transporting ATPase subunit epsilon